MEQRGLSDVREEFLAVSSLLPPQSVRLLSNDDVTSTSGDSGYSGYMTDGLHRDKRNGKGARKNKKIKNKK